MALKRETERGEVTATVTATAMVTETQTLTTDTGMETPPDVLYRNTQALHVGDVHRFIITYTPTDITKELGSHLYIKIKNTENVLMNSALLTGPYMLYCDIRSQEYTHKKECFVSDDQPVYDPNIIPGNSLVHRLTLNRLKDKYTWYVDVISQIVFSTSAEINFEIVIAKSEAALSSSSVNHLKNSNYYPQCLHIQHLTTLDIWNKPPQSSTDPIHLVILTHGLHSNTSADLFYMKEQIEEMASSTGENIVIRGYFGNVCKTERGIKYLGRRLAEFVVNESLKGLDVSKVKKVSFIAHSLGGPVQTFAISYINYNYPEFFQNIAPENFITLASPLLGISNENPAYVKVFLKFGIVGKTGQDLNLDGAEPLLLLLPSEPTRKILKRFKRRTVYANVLNDGIVPLRTSALLYLDWKALTKIYETLHNGDSSNMKRNDMNETGEIPVEMNKEMDNAENIEVGTNLASSIKSKFQSTLGFCFPNMQASKTTQKYNYFQTTEDTVPENDNGRLDLTRESMTPIPRSSVLSSLRKVLLPPSPSPKYINDPKSRDNVILHDKIYTPDMIPKSHTVLSKNVIISHLTQNKRHRFFEEKIARRWHQGMTWKKVLVNLQPDAHNNMIVRRRFANAYGWGVIDHLVETHFSNDCFKGADLEQWEYKKKIDDNIELDEAELKHLNSQLGKVIDREYLKQNTVHTPCRLKKIFSDSSSPSPSDPDCKARHNEDKEVTRTKGSELSQHYKDTPNGEVNEHEAVSVYSGTSSAINDGAWLNETESGYYDGPTGMINTVNEWKDNMLYPKSNGRGTDSKNAVPPAIERNECSTYFFENV